MYSWLQVEVVKPEVVFEMRMHWNDYLQSLIDSPGRSWWLLGASESEKPSFNGGNNGSDLSGATLEPSPIEQKVSWHLPGSLAGFVPRSVQTGSSFSCVSMDTCQSAENLNSTIILKPKGEEEH